LFFYESINIENWLIVFRLFFAFLSFGFLLSSFFFFFNIFMKYFFFMSFCTLFYKLIVLFGIISLGFWNFFLLNVLKKIFGISFMFLKVSSFSFCLSIVLKSPGIFEMVICPLRTLLLLHTTQLQVQYWNLRIKE